MAGEEKITAHIVENGKSAYAVDINVSGYDLQGDEPQPMGDDLAPAPYDFLLAALGECTAMTVRWYARKQNWPLDRVEINISHQKVNASDLAEAEENSGKIDFFEKEVIVYGDDLTSEQRKKLVDIAAKCPVQRTLQSKVVIRTLEK